MKKCPCCSGSTYDACCQPFHQGALPETALQLMRSRYSAFALDIPDYIIETTHLKNVQYEEDRQGWKQKVSQFSKATTFEGLEILEHAQEGSAATVTFTAHLKQGKRDVTFTEKSFFEKMDGRWLYREGRVS